MSMKYDDYLIWKESYENDLWNMIYAIPLDQRIFICDLRLHLMILYISIKTCTKIFINQNFIQLVQ